MKNILLIAGAALALTACADTGSKTGSGDTATTTGGSGTPGFADPVIVSADPLVCTGANLELSVTVTGVTSGSGTVYIADINNAAPFGEEHTLEQDLSLDTDTTETLTRSLVADSGLDAVPDESTIFSCASHLNGVEETTAAVYSMYDIDGNFADCAGQGTGWEGLLAADAADYNAFGPSNLDELSAANCTSL